MKQFIRRIGAPALVLALSAALAALRPGPARAGEVLAAIAANFAEVSEKLAPLFQQQTGHRLRITAGSTGKLYAQIVNGAPFDVFLAADQARPERLEREGRTAPASRFTYAIGQLSLWSAAKDRFGPAPLQNLKPDVLRSFAIANPELAPYGAAARGALKALKLWDGLERKIVMGQNVGQAYALIASGNAEMGIIARSYVMSPRNRGKGSRWDIPARLHAPVRQDAVLLARAADNPAATAFMEFLKSDEAAKVIRSFGYGVD